MSSCASATLDDDPGQHSRASTSGRAHEVPWLDYDGDLKRFAEWPPEKRGSPLVMSGDGSHHPVAQGVCNDNGCRHPSRRRLRLHRRRRGLGRLRAGQPAVGRSQVARAAARGGRPRQLDLVPHSGRLSLRDRQSALGLDVPDREGAGPERPQPQLSARQGDRRLLGDQRHDLDARPVPRLRPLAPARPHRLGLGRRPAGLQAARRSLPGRHRASRRAAANGGSSSRACDGTCSTPSSRRRPRWAFRGSPTSTPATTPASATSM